MKKDSNACRYCNVWFEHVIGLQAKPHTDTLIHNLITCLHMVADVVSAILVLYLEINLLAASGQTWQTHHPRIFTARQTQRAHQPDVS